MELREIVYNAKTGETETIVTTLTAEQEVEYLAKQAEEAALLEEESFVPDPDLTLEERISQLELLLLESEGLIDGKE